MRKELPKIDSLWNFNDPKSTEESFKKLLAEIEIQADQNYIIQLKTQITRTLGLQQKFEDGHTILNSLDISKMDDLSKVRYYLERGRLFNSNNEQEKALPEFMNAWEIAKGSELHNLAVDAAHMIAIAERETDTQIKWNMIAIEYAENSGDEEATKWLGSLLNNTGWSFHDKGDYGKALELFEKAYEFRKTQGNDNTIRVAKWCIARVQRSLENYDLALKLQYELLSETQQKGTNADGYTYEELGELYLIKEMKSESQKYFGLAYEKLSQDAWLVKNESERLERIRKLGDRNY